MSFFRGLIALSLLAGLLFVGGMALLSPLINRVKAASQDTLVLSEEIGQLQARLAVLRAETTSDENWSADGYQISARDDLEAEVGIQSLVLEVLSNKGISPISFAPIAPSVETSAKTVGFEVEFETAYANAIEAIASLEQQTPLLAIDSLWIRSVPISSMPEAVSPVYVRLGAWTFWAPRVSEDG